MALLRSLNISFTNSPVLAEKRKSRPNRKTTAMSDVEEETIMQAEFLAKDIVECLLNASSISVNGYTDVPTGTLKDVSDQHSCIRNNQAFLRARENIIAGCTYMQQQHGREIERMCTRFEVDDVQLNTNFEEVLATIWTEPRNWGRLISLFVATYYICKRLDQENDKDKIQSVIGWLGSFLKTNAVTWVVEHGGFTGVLYGTTVPSSSRTDRQLVVDDCKTNYTARAGLVTLALGFGAAVVVGTIIGR